MIALAGLLAFACNVDKKAKESMNPFFSEYKTAFEVPPFDKIEPAHFMPAFREGMKRQDAEIAVITGYNSEPDFFNTIVALDRTGALLTAVSDVFFNLTSANTSDSIQAIAREVAPLLASHKDNINLNEELFEKVETVYQQNKDNTGLPAEDRMLLEKTYKNFVRGGALLTGEDKKRFREINKELALLTVQFGDNLLEETNTFQLVIENPEDLAGLPDFVVDMGAADAKATGLEGRWLYTLHKPSLIPFLQYSEMRELREKMFLGYINRGNNGNERDNKDIALRMSLLRLERANLLGYESHAAYVLDNNMAKNPEKVYELMDKIWAAALPVAKEEAEELRKMIAADGKDHKLEPWDWWYYSEKLRKEKYDLDEEQLKPYFELTNVYNGMFDVANKLFGLTFRVRDDIPKPHPDAITYEVLDNDGTHQAVLIMDFFPRASKEGGAWMSSYRKQYRTDDQYVTPVITMVMNFSKPTADKPSLLSFEEVSTMFHEFGHALHGMLSDCSYRLLSGTSVARDFVELPSQIMENWAAEPEVLQSFAKHYQTGEPIPQELIEKMKQSKNFNQGFAVTEFTAAAYLDMAWHTITEPGVTDPIAFENTTLKGIGLIPEIVVRYRTPYFAHIFAGGYSAGYYAYQWAEVLDADAFMAFKENGLFDRKTAGLFRENILSKGGTEDPMELYIRFRGKEPDPNAMLRRKGLIGG